MSAGFIAKNGSEDLRPISDWKEAMAKIRKVNKQLAEDLKSAKSQFESHGQPFWLAKYPYGDLLVENGNFKLPSSYIGKAHAMGVPPYNSPPLVLVLEKSVEAFFNTPYDHEKGHLVPLRLIPAGEMFGVFEAADRVVGLPPANADYSISAGSRSIWIVAPIANRDLKNLLDKQLNISKGRETWHHSDAHYKLVKGTTGISTRWHTTVLIFPECLTSPETGRDFAHNLLELGWTQSTNSRRQFGPDADLKQLCSMQHTSAEAARLAQHLVGAVRGEFPLFCPINELSEPAGPFSEFQTALRGVLGDKTKLRYKNLPEPIVLQATNLTKPGQFAYYSFLKPSIRHPPPPNQHGSLCHELGQLFNINSTGEKRELISRLLRYRVRDGESISEVVGDLKFFSQGRTDWTFYLKSLPLSDFGLTDAVQTETRRGFLSCCVRIGLSESEVPSVNAEDTN